MLESRKLLKGMCLFKESEKVDGVYLIESGEFTYEKITFENDATVPSTNWTQPRLFIGGSFKKARNMQIAIMSGKEVLGFEEVLR
jgi:hypothetical protein